MRYLFLSSVLTSVLLGPGLAIAQDQSTDYPPSQQQQQQHQQMQPPPMQQRAGQIQQVDTFFATDSAQLAPGARQDLQQLANWARCSSKNAIILEGHADTRGTAKHNLKLSGERAATVRQTLVEMGVPSERIVITVFGKNGPPKPTLREERRVTARAVTTPVEPTDLAG